MNSILSSPVFYFLAFSFITGIIEAASVPCDLGKTYPSRDKCVPCSRVCGKEYGGPGTAACLELCPGYQEPKGKTWIIEISVPVAIVAFIATALIVAWKCQLYQKLRYRCTHQPVEENNHDLGANNLAQSAECNSAQGMEGETLLNKATVPQDEPPTVEDLKYGVAPVQMNDLEIGLGTEENTERDGKRSLIDPLLVAVDTAGS